MHVKELLSLKNKIILVTGGAGLYGKSIVEGLAEADGTVITASRNLEADQKVAKEFSTRGLDVHAMQVDQADHESVISLKHQDAGVINLTRYLARVLADKNIRANCTSPGGLFNNQPQQFLDNYCKKVPSGSRMANNDDIKGLVVLLASEASAYINGENILMDGGMHA